MLIFDATTKSLEVKLSGAPATNQLPIVVCYVDHTTTTYVPGASQTATNSGTAVTALAAPVASTQRQLKFMAIRQKDTAAVTLTAQYNDNGTLRELWKGTLAVDDTLFYEEGSGFYVMDSTGGVKGAGTGGATYTDEQAQDAVAAMSVDTATVNVIYTDATPELKWDVLPGGIKLDDLGTPDDNTDLNVSTSLHGLAPKIAGSDGYVLTKSGSAAVWSAATGGATEQDKIDLAWDKKFFTDLGVVPATERIAATLATFPTEAGTSGGTWTKNNGWATLVVSGTGQLVYWDLGAARSDILVAIGGLHNTGITDISIHLSASAPGADPDGFNYWITGGNLALYKHASGSYTQIGSNVGNIGGSSSGLAFYYKDSTDTLTGYARVSDRWMQIITATNTSFTTFRYVGIRAGNSGTLRLLLPFVAYSD